MASPVIEDIGCICGHRQRVDLHRATESSRVSSDVLLWVSYMLCPSCGLVGKHPLPGADELRAFYSSSWQFSTPRPIVCWTSAAEFIARNMRMMGLIPIRDTYPDRTACDVGSKGTTLGDILGEMGVSMRWSAFDPAPVDGGVSPGWMGDGIDATKTYDFVSATHVLEHSRDPIKFLRDLMGLLKPHGVAYVEVPSLELSDLSAGNADDICRDHLWHFTTNAVTRMVHEADKLFGCRIAAIERGEVDGWPVHRLLLLKPDGARGLTKGLFLGSVASLWSVYGDAARALGEYDSGETALYGASQSYYYMASLWPETLRAFRVFDLNKTGRTPIGVEIEHPDRLESSGLKRLVITTRFWNSYQDCMKYLAGRFPDILIETPYRSMR